MIYCCDILTFNRSFDRLSNDISLVDSFYLLNKEYIEEGEIENTGI